MTGPDCLEVTPPDLDTGGKSTFVLYQQPGSGAPQCLCQKDGGTAVQNPERLSGSVIDGHFSAYEIAPHGCKTDANTLYSRIFMRGRQCRQVITCFTEKGIQIQTFAG